MALVLTALWRYLTNSVTQTPKYILSKLHMGGIFFFVFTEFNQNFVLKKGNIIGI